jgi:hypothetical protein
MPEHEHNLLYNKGTWLENELFEFQNILSVMDSYDTLSSWIISYDSTILSYYLRWIANYNTIIWNILVHNRSRPHYYIITYNNKKEYCITPNDSAFLD